MRVGHGAQERLRLNRTWKVNTIYTWLVKTLHNVLFSFALSLVLVLPSYLLLYLDFIAFSFSMPQTVGCVQYSAPQNAYVAEDQPRCPTGPPLSRSAVLPCESSIARLSIRYSPVQCQCTWRISSVTWAQINVPERVRHVRTSRE